MSLSFSLQVSFSLCHFVLSISLFLYALLLPLSHSDGLPRRSHRKPWVMGGFRQPWVVLWSWVWVDWGGFGLWVWVDWFGGWLLWVVPWVEAVWWVVSFYFIYFFMLLSAVVRGEKLRPWRWEKLLDRVEKDGDTVGERDRGWVRNNNKNE